MSKSDIVWECLKKNKSLTTLEIQQLVWTTCPHGIIRDLRNKGHKILDEWVTTTREKQTNKGYFYKETVRYKRYYLEENNGNRCK